MERYLGIDLHRDSSTIVVLSAAGKRVRRDLVETNGQSLVRYVRQLQGTLHICVEESSWSEWIYEILSPHVAELVVYQQEWKPGAKSDAIDAHGLAEKLRLGQAGPGVFKAPKRYRRLREWARGPARRRSRAAVRLSGSRVRGEASAFCIAQDTRPRHPSKNMPPHRTRRRHGPRGPDASMVQRPHDQDDLAFHAGEATGSGSIDPSSQRMAMWPLTTCSTGRSNLPLSGTVSPGMLSKAAASTVS